MKSALTRAVPHTFRLICGHNALNGPSRPVAAVRWLEALPIEFGLRPDPSGLPADVDLLVASVNLLRLKKNPVSPGPEDIEDLYLALSAETGGTHE